MRPVGLPWASCVWKMRRGRMLLGGGGRPSDVAPSPSPTPPPSRPSMPDTLRPPRMGSASSFSTSGDAFFRLPRPRGIVVQGSTDTGEGKGGGCSRDLWAVQTNIHLSTQISVTVINVYATGMRWSSGPTRNAPQPGVFLNPNICIVFTAELSTSAAWKKTHLLFKAPHIYFKMHFSVSNSCNIVKTEHSLHGGHQRSSCPRFK